MERNFVLALAGVAMGVAIAVLWLPPAPAPERVVERAAPVIEPIAPGRRAVVLDTDGKPVPYVDVFLTDIAGTPHRLHAAIRTNFEGHLVVRPGRYRAQVFWYGRTEKLDGVIEVPEGEHPDVELRLTRAQLFQWLARR